MHKFEGFINCSVCDTIYGEQESTFRQTSFKSASKEMKNDLLGECKEAHIYLYCSWQNSEYIFVFVSHFKKMLLQLTSVCIIPRSLTLRCASYVKRSVCIDPKFYDFCLSVMSKCINIKIIAHIVKDIFFTSGVFR